MQYLRAFATLLFLASPVLSAEWTGFGDVSIGADITRLSGFHRSVGDFFVRDADADTMKALGLSRVTYETAGPRVFAVEFTTQDEEATKALIRRVVMAYGKASKDGNVFVWRGGSTQVSAVGGKDGIAIFRLERLRPLPPPTPEPQASGRDSNSELMDWMEDERKKDAAKAQAQAEAQARADAAAQAAAQRQAEIDAQTNEIVDRVNAAQEAARAEEEKRARACGAGAHWVQFGNTSTIVCRDVGGVSVPDYCCSR